MSAGTSDIPVAEEAVVTLEIMGNKVEKLYDVILLLPFNSLANGVAGIHRLFQSKFLMDLKVNDDVFSGDIIVADSKAGAQIAVSHHTSVSVGPASLVVINRRIDKRKKESHHITLLRGRVRTTSYGKILLESADKKIYIQTPYGTFSFNGADLVVSVNDTNAQSKGTSLSIEDNNVPCQTFSMLEAGGLPKKSSVTMEQCPEGSKKDEVVFVGFQQPPLLSMINSCAAGVTVVNIDNGFGAAYAASQINRL